MTVLRFAEVCRPFFSLTAIRPSQQKMPNKRKWPAQKNARITTKMRAIKKRQKKEKILTHAEEEWTKRIILFLLFRFLVVGYRMGARQVLDMMPAMWCAISRGPSARKCVIPDGHYSSFDRACINTTADERWMIVRQQCQ